MIQNGDHLEYKFVNVTNKCLLVWSKIDKTWRNVLVITLKTYNIYLHALPPAGDMVDAGIVAEDVHLAIEVALAPVVQSFHIILLGHVTPCNNNKVV